MSVNTNEYEVQLLNVEQALESTQSEAVREELLALKKNLIELLQLTKSPSTKVEDDDDDDDEPKEENKQQDSKADERMCEAEPTTRESATDNADEDPEMDELKTRVELMIGQKCSAPHHHSWGATSYHNAIVCGAEDTAYVSDDGDLDVRLRVLFTNPTRRKMVPCNHYLEGKCRFNDESCHYSHGESVALSELREYSMPVFERLSRNCIVLAKLPDRIWYRGRVLCVNFIEKQCRVRLEGENHNEREKDFSFEDLLPIYSDDDLSNESSSNSDDELDLPPTDHQNETSEPTFTYKLSQPLGDWEKHTRGIGSKLMAKMGYKYGAGLGLDGRGMVNPVPVEILPPGRSLDHCMEMRKAANGDKDLGKIEKKLRRQQQKQVAINAKAYEREKARTDVFSFLNENILANPKCSNVANSSSAHPSAALQKQTTKSLNVESVRIADNIRKKEREIAEVQKSLKRNTNGGTAMAGRLQEKLNLKTKELRALQQEEIHLSKEQATRKTKDKLCVF